MKNLIYISTIFFVIMASFASKSYAQKTDKTKAVSNDTLKIKNEELKYEVIIIEPGFDYWLQSTAYPRGYHSQSFLESKNNIYVSEWNYRVRQPQKYLPNLYEMTIDYDPNTDYGYEVNYLLYNYMIYFQNKYNQKLYGYVPPR